MFLKLLLIQNVSIELSSRHKCIHEMLQHEQVTNVSLDIDAETIKTTK